MLNYSIVTIKKTTSLFLAFILVVGTIASISPFMTGAQAEQYYGVDSDKKSDTKQVSVSSLKCNNINVNVNGLELDVFPPFLADSGVGTETQEGNTDVSSFAGNSDASEINDFRFTCINNNNNTVIQEEPPIPPEPTTGTLQVVKHLTCEPFPDAPPEFSPPPALCEELLALITPDQFLFQVEGNNPNPSSQIPGSPTGTNVRLGTGNYVVNETPTQSVFEDSTTFLDSHPEVLSFRILPIFTGDCTNLIGSLETATGTIAAGESQTCIGLNQIQIAAFPEPTTATLTVKKQVFGCAEFNSILMTCSLPNDSPAWLDCNDNPTISGTEFCISLPESLFDIDVLDDQNNQIHQFEGSEQGTTIENLEPGTYTVNEIIHPSNVNQLGENASVAGACTFSLGFSGGGQVLNTTTNISYGICFEYEDEQGNDCSTITLAAGEERTCIVKNYIGTAFNSP